MTCPYLKNCLRLAHCAAQGMLEGVLDVAWTCDQTSVLGAGNDKSIRVWDPTTGRVRHTMTGHTGKVQCQCTEHTDHCSASTGYGIPLNFSA